MKYKENIIKWNLEKYNYTKEKYRKFQVQLFMEKANTHLISKFKDFLFYDDITEFLSRFFILKESLQILVPLLNYYEKSSYIFPNYTTLHEGKYIYQNIVKKQLLINYLEDLEIKKNYKYNQYMNKNMNKSKYNKNFDKIFDTQLYDNILNNNNNDSNLNLLFGIKMNNNKNTKEKSNNNNSDINHSNETKKDDDSIRTFKKIINAITESSTKSIGINTLNTNILNNNKFKVKGKNDISLKGISNSTNCASNYSNSNMNSMLKRNKGRINNKNIRNNINNKNSYCTTLDNYFNTFDNSYNSNYGIYLEKNLTYKKSMNKNRNNFLNYFNSSFMKSFISKLYEKKCTSSSQHPQNFFYMKKKLIKTKKSELTPIIKLNHYISTWSLIKKNPKISLKTIKNNITQFSSIKSFLTNKNKITKTNKNSKILTLNNNNSHIKKFKKNILDSRNKGGVLVQTTQNSLRYNHLHNHQRNNIINFENSNLYSLTKTKTSNNSLVNSIYKTINIINRKKQKPKIQYRKDTKQILGAESHKNQNQNSFLKKKIGKYYTNNISKKKLNKTINIEEGKKKTIKQNDLNRIFFKTKLPSPLQKVTINNQSNSRYKNKNKNVYKDLKINSNNTLVVSIKPPDLHKKEKKI